MKFSAAGPMLPSLPSAPIVLTIRGLGHVPSFKNTKSIYRRKSGSPFIATKKERKEWMERVIQSFVSQLLSASQTIGSGTIQGRSKLSSIASCVPADDSLQWIPKGSFDTEHVAKGEEGAVITIERIS